MQQTEQQKRKVIAELLFCVERLARCIKTKQANDHDLDLTWTLLMRHEKSRRLLKEFNALLPEELVTTPRSRLGYKLNNQHLETLRQAKQMLELRSVAMRVELVKLAENQLERDLAKLNDWWRQCSSQERDIGFAAMASALDTEKPAKLLVSASGEKRILLLAIAMEAVERAFTEAKQQQERFQKLCDNDKSQIKKSIEKHTGIPAKKWWNSATIAERTHVLKSLLDALQTSKEHEKAQNTGNSNVA
jgi:hypothetical protein